MDGVRSHAMYCVAPVVELGQFVKRQPVIFTGLSPLPKESFPAVMLLVAEEPETVADTAGLALVRSQDTSCAPEGELLMEEGEEKKKKKNKGKAGTRDW